MEMLHKGVKKSCDNCFIRKSCLEDWPKYIPEHLGLGYKLKMRDREKYGFCSNWRWVIEKEPIFIKKQEIHKQLNELGEKYLELRLIDEEKADELQEEIAELWNEMNRLGDELDK